MTPSTNILVVDDEKGSRETLSAIPEEEGYRVFACQSVAEAMKQLMRPVKEGAIDLVISDLKLIDGSGLEILWALKKISPDASFILITGYATVDNSIDALNQGAFASHVKPVDMEALCSSIRNALIGQRLTVENRNLLDQLQRFNEELEQARDAALDASQAKSYFLASMSHEIRTPMNAILGMAELLSGTPLTIEQQEYVRVFRGAGENLLDIINDILDLSKVEAGHFELDDVEFNFEELVEDNAAFLAVRAHGKGLEFTVM